MSIFLMESSNDSFLWSNASNDSIEYRNNTNIKCSDAQYEEKLIRGADSDPEVGVVMHETSNENETRIKRKKRKRNCSQAIEEGSDYSQPEGKRIKLEPESDIDVGKKGMLGKEKNKHNNLEQSIIHDDEEYLNLRVKQEQSSLVQTKKEKTKQSLSGTDNACESDRALETNPENYLDMQVKREQASVIEPMSEKPKKKKKKKHKNSIAGSDIDTVSETKLSMKSNEANFSDDSLAIRDQTKYFVIEEKFSAEETIVENPKKKKHNKDARTKDNYDSDNESIHVITKSGTVSETNNDLSLEPSDFTCNNIISSTIINNSAMGTLINSSLTAIKDNKPVKKTEDLLRRNKNKQTVKISDRIEFEDDISNQQSNSSGTSARINLFLKANPHLKLFSREIPIENIITKDDEICSLKWSHKIDLNRLKNTLVLSEEKCKIKVDGQTYDGIPNKDEKTITLLTYHDRRPFITNLPVKLCMNYQKRIPKVHIPDNNIMINNQTNTLLPETKCRHPLFGAHYKKAIKISTAVKERLQAAKVPLNETPSKYTSKKKNKKDKHIKVEEDVCVKQEYEPIKKKRKHNHSQSDYIPSKKTKYIKQDADSSVVWESEKAIEENLFNF